MKNRVKQTLIHIAFGIYILIMLWLMFGQRIAQLVNAPASSPTVGYWSEFLEKLNVIPFETIIYYSRSLAKGINSAAIVNLVGNVVMFIPLGFFLPCVSKKARTLKGDIVMALICILCAEIVQVFTLLGYFDVDDLILNMLGVYVGFLLYASAFRRSAKSKG